MEPIKSKLSVITIGISGATRSGKSTLTSQLKNQYETIKTIHQDEYFNLKKIVENGNNWELPNVIDHDDFIKDILQAKKELKEEKQNEQFRFLILEGFQLYCERRIFDLVDIKIWLEIPEDVIYERRMRTKPQTDEYFQNLILPSYREYKLGCDQMENVFKIDGTKSKELIFMECIQIIDEYITKIS